MREHYQTGNLPAREIFANSAMLEIPRVHAVDWRSTFPMGNVDNTQERIRNAIVTAAATQGHGYKKRLADALGQRSSWISKVLKGTATVGVEHISVIARLTGRSVSDLLENQPSGATDRPLSVVESRDIKKAGEQDALPGVKTRSLEVLDQEVRKIDGRVGVLEVAYRANLKDLTELDISKDTKRKRRRAARKAAAARSHRSGSGR
jgi:transcriptional regulator with XRE-family HTH domain